MTPPVDPRLEELFQAARRDDWARGGLADYMEERGANPQALRWVREETWAPTTLIWAVHEFLGHQFVYKSEESARKFGDLIWTGLDGQPLAGSWAVALPSLASAYGWKDKHFVGLATTDRPQDGSTGPLTMISNAWKANLDAALDPERTRPSSWMGFDA